MIKWKVSKFNNNFIKRNLERWIDILNSIDYFKPNRKFKFCLMFFSDDYMYFVDDKNTLIKLLEYGSLDGFYVQMEV